MPASLEGFAKFTGKLKAETPLEVVVIRKGKTETVGSITMAPAKYLAGDYIYYTTTKVNGEVWTFTGTDNEGKLALSVRCIVKDGQVFVGSIEIMKDGKDDTDLFRGERRARSLPQPRSAG